MKNVHNNLTPTHGQKIITTCAFIHGKFGALNE